MPQVKNSFDKKTWNKILKGLGLNLIGAITAFITAITQGVDVQTATLIALGTFGASIANIAKEYKKGE